MSAIDVTVRLRADGEDLKVEIEALGSYETGLFQLPPEAWRDITGALVPPGHLARGFTAVEGFGDGGTREPDERTGLRLFEALFPGRVRSLLDRLRGSGRPLNLRLVWDAEDERLAPLHRLPWELLHLPDTKAALGLEPALGFSRHLDVAAIRPTIHPPETLRIVVVASNPRETSALGLDAEVAGLLALESDRALEVIPVPRPVDLQTVRSLLETRQAHVLHFMGHGEVGVDGKGRLLFEDPDGWPLGVTGEDLAKKLQGLEHLWLVVLNACRTADTNARPFDSVATRLVRSAVPAVVAMQGPIPDNVAITFSHEFYPRLARGHTLERAVCEGRHAIHSRTPGETTWAIPVLFSRASGTTIGGLEEGELPSDERVVRERYLSWMVESCRELDVPWPSAAGPPPRLQLETICSLLSHDPESPTEHPRRPRTYGASVERLSGSVSAEEEELFVWRQLRRAARGGVNIASPERKAAQTTAGDISFHDAIRRHSRIVLLGDAGTGKTSLLRWLARCSAESLLHGDARLQAPAHRIDPRRDDDVPIDLGPARIPVLLDLAAYSQQRKKSDNNLRLAAFLGRHLGAEPDDSVADAAGDDIDPKILQRVLRRELRRGDAVLLCDKLDEVVDLAERLDIVREVEACLAALGCRAIIASRAIGYRRAAFSQPAVCLELKPLSGPSLQRLCRFWAEATGVENHTLVAAVGELQRQGADETVASPLMISALAVVLLAHGGLPSRRIDFYASLVGVLLARQQEDLPAAPEGLAEPLSGVLAALAAEVLGLPESFGLLGHRQLTATLDSLFGSKKARVLERLLHRDLGPLMHYGGGVCGFLCRPVQEYLAASWLASDPAEAEERLRQRLDDPAWRVPSAMALGLLAETLGRTRLSALIGRLLARDAASATQPVPYAGLLILEALGELPMGFSPPFADLAVALFGSAAASGSDGSLERVFASVLKGPYLDAADRALARLAEENPSRMAAPLARIALEAPSVPPRLAAALFGLGRHDKPPWWIDRALRHLSRRDPSLLPRGSLGRILNHNPDFSTRIAGDPRWRRLVHAVGGDGVQPFRQSTIDGLVLRTLGAFQPAESLVPALSGMAQQSVGKAAREACRALLALGCLPPVPQETSDGFRADLDYLRTETISPSKATTWLHPLLEARPQLGSATWLSLVQVIVNRLAVEERADLYLLLASEAPETERSRLLALFWRILLFPEPRESNALHRAAVALDQHGAFLTSPLSTFVDSWLAAGQPFVESSTLGSQTLAERLAAVLDVLAGIPESFDFVRAWSLVVLQPALDGCGLLDEAIIMAETSLSDRFGSRKLARRSLLGTDALVGDEALVERARAITDPWRRWRALQRLAAGVASLRSSLVSDHIAAHRILMSPATMAAWGIRDPHRRRWPLAHLETEASCCGPEGIDPAKLVAAISRLGDVGPENDLVVLGALADVVLGYQSQRHSTNRSDPVSRARSGVLDRDVVADLIDQVENGDDLDRLQASLALFGDRSPLRRRWPLRRVGADVAFRLAGEWLQRRMESPQTALVLRWTFEALEHDTPKVLQLAAQALERPGLEAESAEVVLRFIETVSLEALPTLGEILHDGARRARRALVHGLPNLLAASNRYSNAVWSAIVDALPAAADCFGNRSVQLHGPRRIVDAADRAYSEGGGVDRASEIHRSSATLWAELLLCEPQEMRGAFAYLGTRRRIGEKSNQGYVEAAAGIYDRPVLLPLLMDWLEQRLLSDPYTDIDNRVTSDLLMLVATAARRLPRTYFQAIEDRPSWGFRLADLAEYADWLPTRRTAVELLGMGRLLGDRELRALLATLQDAPEIQRTTLESLAFYRRLADCESLEPILHTLEDRHPSRVYAAARLLAALARPRHCEPGVRRSIEAALASVAAAPSALREVHAFNYSSSPKNRHVRIESLGRLDRLVRGLLLEIQVKPVSSAARSSEASN
ncbi:MAG: CHAT domain-containing protein [Thermoanaerobaculia bacterium]|nr:CHAT domain-containing protein [Thermoanaerobaculia bacterium]